MSEKSKQAGIKNCLTYINNLTPEQLREKASRAGKISNEKRRKRKALKEYLEAILMTETETGDYITDMTISLIKKAINGDVKAYETIRDTLGEKPKEEVALSTADSIQVNISADEDTTKPQ